MKLLKEDFNNNSNLCNKHIRVVRKSTERSPTIKKLDLDEALGLK